MSLRQDLLISTRATITDDSETGTWYGFLKSIGVLNLSSGIIYPKVNNADWLASVIR